MRPIEEIYQELLDAFAERAGFVPESGCDLAVRLWAAAAQLQALGIQADWVLDQSFPQTAQGKYLDYQGQMRGLTRLASTKAAVSSFIRPKRWQRPLPASLCRCGFSLPFVPEHFF